MSHPETIVNIGPYCTAAEHLENEIIYGRQLCMLYIDPQGGDLETVRGQRAQNDRRAARTADVPLPLVTLVQCLGLSDAERDVLILLSALERDRTLRCACQLAWDHSPNGRISVGLIVEILCQAGRNWDEVLSLFAATAPLRRHGLISLGEPSGPDEAVQLRPLGLSLRVLSFLSGSERLDEQLAPYARLFHCDVEPSAVAVPPAALRRLSAVFERTISGSQRLNLYGPAGSGAIFCSRALLPGEQRLLIINPCSLLGTDNLATILRLAIRETVLQNLVLFLDFGDLGEIEAITAQDRCQIAHLFRDFDRLLLIGSREPLPLFGDHGMVRAPLPLPQTQERLTLWRCALRGVPADLDLAAVAAQFPLSAGAIEQAARHARDASHIEGGGQLTQRGVIDAARRFLTSALDDLARRIPTRMSWDDVILPTSVMEKLSEISSFAREREGLREIWGFGARQSKGSGLSMLFYGPPGTGKTVVASILAGELGLDLFQVDLSMVTSKWVGETEKNLGKIFDAAEQSQAILLFDEADSLFAKRTSEIKSSNDRHSNREVNYLLQRMEQYRGISILTSNLANGLDEAFQRRIRFKAHFPFPDAEQREQLWRNLIPEQAPVERSLRFGELSRRFELSGAQIENAILRGAARARARGVAIGFDDLNSAAIALSQELGRAVRTDRPDEFDGRPVVG